MRGKDKSGAVISRLVWITPAYAGKRYRPLCRRRSLRDHPRLCGEK